MDDSAKSFLRDVLANESQNHNVFAENTRRHFAVFERMFRDAEVDRRKKDSSAQNCFAFCRERVVQEIARH
jgi:hypothetical protein